MGYSIVKGTYYFPGGDFFVFEGLVGDAYGGGSFTKGQYVRPGDTAWDWGRYWDEKDYIEIWEATNYPGTEYGSGHKALTATHYYDHKSHRLIETEDAPKSTYLGSMDGEIALDGLIYDFEVGKGIDFPGANSNSTHIAATQDIETDFEWNILYSTQDIESGDDGWSFVYSSRGKGKMKGTDSGDDFTFSLYDSFGRRTADKIIDFNSKESDKIVFTEYSLPGVDELGGCLKQLTVVDSRKKLNKAKKESTPFVYNKNNGQLFYNGNLHEPGWGDSGEGGLLAILKGSPRLTGAEIEVNSPHPCF